MRINLHNPRLIIDFLAAVIYLVAANPLITGLALHEWLSCGLLIVFIVHCAIDLDTVFAWIRSREAGASRLHLLLDGFTLVVFMACTVSGLLVSRYILPLFGLVAPGYFFWLPLHSLTAKMLLALLLVHVAVHLPWFAARFSKRK
jgi:hypothetical protein